MQSAYAGAAALVAGAMNSLAGGGTIVTFPTLVWLGLPPLIANATNTVAIWPGSIGSLWGFRRELGHVERAMFLLTIPSLGGGAAGAILLRLTPPGVFDRLVPFLILFATLLFALQPAIRKRAGAGHLGVGPLLATQFLVSIYGGYFGAGMGIMMLSALSLAGMTDVLKMNALASVLSLCINGIAAGLFIWSRMVYWPLIPAMAAAAIVGGYLAAKIARKVGKDVARRFVVAIGFGITAALFVRMWRG